VEWHCRAQEYARPDHRQIERGNQRCSRRRKFRGRISDLGSAVLTGSPADFEKLIADEIEKWGKVIRAATSSRSDPARHALQNSRGISVTCPGRIGQRFLPTLPGSLDTRA